MKNKNRVINAGVWYTVANFLTKGAIFLTTPFFTRMMTKEDIGSFSNLSSWVEILIPLTTFELSVSLGIARFDYEKELNKYISSLLIYGSIITSLLFSIIFFNMDAVCDFFSLKSYMLIIVYLYLLFYPALQMFQSENRFRYKYILSTAVSFASIVISVIVAILCVYSFNNKLFGRILGYFGVLIVFNICIYVFLLIRGHSFSWQYLNYSFSISFPMIWHTLSLRLLNAGDRIVITRTIGEEANAMYTISSTCCHVVAVLYSSMNNAWSPWSTEKMNSNDIIVMKEKSRQYIILYSVIVLMFMLVCPEMLLIMGGKDYLVAKYVLPPILVSCVFQFVYSLYINAEFYLKKQTRIAFGTIIASLINIGLNVIFVPRFGYLAAAYTTLVGYVLLFVFHLVSLILLKKGDWYDNTFNITVCIGFIIIMFFVNWIYRNDAIRYCVLALYIVALCIVGIINRDVIKKYIIMLIG